MKQLTLRAFCLFTGICAISTTGRASDLFVGNFFGDESDVLRYNGTTGAFISVFVPHNSGGLTFPLGGTFGPGGSFYASNSDNDTIVRYNGVTGAFQNIFASSVEDPARLAFGPDGNLYVANATDPGSVTKLNGSTGALITEFTTAGLVDPEGLTFGPDGNLYVANLGGNDVVRFNGMTGAFIDIFVTAGSGGLSSPRDLTFGADGNLYVTSNAGGTGAVLRYSGTTGAFVNAFVAPGAGLSMARGLTFGPDGNLYVADFSAGDILRFNGSSGALIDTFVPTGSGGLGGPTFLLFHQPASAVPEPSSAVVFIGIGAAVLVLRKRMPVFGRLG